MREIHQKQFCSLSN